ncbi:MAG TPA: aminotransferase class IV, partial [Anaerolineales bacterium]|nr:aminotransferase class IV [Anaerolineales bacterium]
DEYDEALLKARVLTESPPQFLLLETLLWELKGGFFLKRQHIERLMDSALYFDFPVSRSMIDEKLSRIEKSFSQPQRVRLLLDREGSLEIQSTTIAMEEKTIHAGLTDKPIDSNDIFLFHKTTCREVYDTARSAHPECDDVLLYNKRGELTEFTIGNLVAELNGELVTPPVECGLLPGTFRSYLLESGQVSEKILSIQQLKNCSKIYRINSLRKWEPVHIQEYNR